MLRSLYTAASGSNAQQFNIDIIANNVANVNTTGFKKSRAEFQDLLNQTLAAPGTISDQGTTDPVGIQVGLGVKVAATQKVFLPGSTIQTGNPLDLTVQGEGFFQVLMDDGSVAYTRDGNWKRDANGTIVTSDGLPLQPTITIPNDATEVVVGQNGTVSIRQAGQATLNQVGQIQLVRFANNAGLEDIGRNLYTETPGSGTPIQGTAGQGEFSRTTVNQGFLENSNVQLVEELINLIIAQRAFEANSKVIKASDEILQATNNTV